MSDTPFEADWPESADGDVFRRLASSQLDFSADHVIDFNVDFADWPPPKAALDWLVHAYPNTTMYEPSGDYDGYVLVKIASRITYELVITTQQRISEAMARYGGICESWGLLHGPPH